VRDPHDPSPPPITPSTIAILINNGDGTLGPYAVYDATATDPDGAGFSVAIADMNADAKPDLVTSGSQVWFLPGNGVGTFGAWAGYAGGNTWIAIGDVNGDGRPDAVVTNKAGHYITVLLNRLDTVTATLQVEFVATRAGDGVELRWSFGDASRVSSATLERSTDATGPWQVVALEQRREGDAFAATDRTADAGRSYFYRLIVSLVDGSSATFGPVSSAAASAGPSVVNFLAPNPTRDASRIEYTVARAGHVRLEVTDVAGRMVATLFDGVEGPGVFHAAWDASHGGERLAAGLYFVRLRAPDRTIARPITRLP